MNSLQAKQTSHYSSKLSDMYMLLVLTPKSVQQLRGTSLCMLSLTSALAREMRVQCAEACKVSTVQISSASKARLGVCVSDAYRN